MTTVGNLRRSGEAQPLLTGGHPDHSPATPGRLRPDAKSAFEEGRTGITVAPLARFNRLEIPLAQL